MLENVQQRLFWIFENKKCKWVEKWNVTTRKQVQSKQNTRFGKYKLIKYQQFLKTKNDGFCTFNDFYDRRKWNTENVSQLLFLYNHISNIFTR